MDDSARIPMKIAGYMLEMKIDNGYFDLFDMVCQYNDKTGKDLSMNDFLDIPGVMNRLQMLEKEGINPTRANLIRESFIIATAKKMEELEMLRSDDIFEDCDNMREGMIAYLLMPRTRDVFEHLKKQTGKYPIKIMEIEPGEKKKIMTTPIVPLDMFLYQQPNKYIEVLKNLDKIFPDDEFVTGFIDLLRSTPDDFEDY